MKIIFFIVITAVILFLSGCNNSKNNQLEKNKIFQNKNSTSILKFKVKDYTKFSYDGASMALDCYFYKGKIIEGDHEGRDMFVLYNFWNNIAQKEEEIEIFITGSKSELRNKYNEFYNFKFPEYCIEKEDIDKTVKNNFAIQKMFAFQISDINE
jgi:hypothetical protein